MDKTFTIFAKGRLTLEQCNIADKTIKSGMIESAYDDVISFHDLKASDIVPARELMKKFGFEVDPEIYEEHYEGSYCELVEASEMVVEANAMYTGGNIWVFYGKLLDGNYFITDDNGWTQVLNANPDEDLDEAFFYEWQQEHLVRELEGEKRTEFLSQMLDWLLENPDYRGGMSEAEVEAYRQYFRIF